LKTELDAGRPVVVALGADGDAGAGHFVTVTGISPDGQWIAFNDPTLGEQVLPIGEFLRLWSLQGSSGVAVRREAAAEGSAGYAPWVALLAGMMALITQTSLVRQRKGIGGSLEPGGTEAGLGSAPAGYRWVFKQMPKYEWQEVQEGWDVVPKTVPNMVQKYEQVGWTTTTQRIPRYKTIQVQDGWTYTYVRVPTYRTERYIRYWRTEYTYQATYRYYYGMRIFAGYKKVARRVPVYGTRSVFAGWTTQTKREPKMVTRTVLAGYDVVERRVPKYDWVERQDGWTTTTEQVPHMVSKHVQVGTEWRWVLDEAPPPLPPVDQEPPPSPSDEDKLTRIEEFLDPVIPPEDPETASPEPVKAPSPESQSTLEPSPTPAQLPSETTDTEPEVPTGIPTAPFPPTSTPTWDELERLRAANEEARQAKIQVNMHEYMDQEPLQYIREYVYVANALDYALAAANRENNPLTLQMLNDNNFYPGQLRPATIWNSADIISVQFLVSLRIDPIHVPNYEPVFFELLVRLNPGAYDKIASDHLLPDGNPSYSWEDLIARQINRLILPPTTQ